MSLESQIAALVTATNALTSEVSGLMAEIRSLISGGVYYAPDGSAAAPPIRFQNAASGLFHAGGDELGVAVAGIERARFTGSGLSTAGVKFPGAQAASADANTLDDYEEGTWTPAIYYQNATGLTITNDIQVGRYTKVGNVVHFTCRLTWTVAGAPVNDNIGINGLPFAAANVLNQDYAGRVGMSSMPSSVANWVLTSSVIFFMAADGTGNQANEVGAGTFTVQVEGFYFV